MSMDMIKWEPMKDLRDEIDRVFDTFFGRMPAISEKEGFWMPSVDVEETDSSYIVRADLPGMEKNDIKIALTEDTLSIKGERKMKKEEKGKTYHRIETSYGKFQRTITLPAEIKPDEAKAEYKNGVLTINLPKSEKSKPKEIEIEVK